MFRAIRRLLIGGQRPAKLKQPSEDLEGGQAGTSAEAVSPQLTDALRALCEVFSSFGLRDQPETVREAAEALAEVACLATTSGR